MGKIICEEEVEVGNSKVEIGIEEDKEIKVGDRYKLIESSSGVVGKESVEVGDTQRMLMRYKYGIVEGRDLEVEVRGIEVNAKSKSVTQSMGGAIGYVSRGLGEEVGREMRERGERGERGKLGTFMVMKGEGLESKIGTRMRERGVKVAGGVEKGVKWEGMRVGGYVEYGEGVYEGKEEVGEKGEVNSKGIMRYVGIGLIGRKDEERWHVEGLARVGKQENDSESGDMGIGEKEGEKERYESGGMYVGGEVGGGYKVGEVKGIGIEMVGRVEMVGVGGREVKMETGEKVEIEGIRVGKIKVGSIGRYSGEEEKS